MRSSIVYSRHGYVAKRLALTLPSPPYLEKCTRPQCFCTRYRVSNLIDSDSFDQRIWSIVAGTFPRFEKESQIILLQRNQFVDQPRLADPRHPPGLTWHLSGELSHSLCKHLSRAQELVFERDVVTKRLHSSKSFQ